MDVIRTAKKHYVTTMYTGKAVGKENEMGKGKAHQNVTVNILIYIPL